MYDAIVVGSCVTDLKFYTDRLPAVGETVKGSFETGLGGKGFNQAVASASSGAKTLFIGAVGIDEFGEKFQNFKLKNLTTKIFSIRGETTGVASINIDKGGNNNIVVSLGANLKLHIDHIKHYCREPFYNAKLLLIQLENNLNFIKDLVKFAKQINPNIQIILNPAPFDGVTSLPSDILNNIQYLTPNETELMSLVGKKRNLKYDKTDLYKLNVLWSSIKTKADIIVTLGQHGSCLISNPHKNTDKMLYFAPLKIKAIDTTGAGDAFNGGLVSGLIKYKFDIQKAIKYATIVAGLSTTKKGTSESMPSALEIRKTLRNTDM